ncbi:MAG TPA: putative DNA-binding domain-containing protein [Candidatus Saccharimonadales bacterium]|nr:putative DNA-binding domain-containing protein [Candidatus Saccharimonadales bacterium]
MNLATLQREVARAVMTPLTPSERMRRKAPNGKSLAKVAARIIKPNDRLTSFERLEIYNRQYWFRVLDGFSEDFPGLRAVLGDRRFDAVAKAYLTDCPSQSFTMRDLGSRLEAWLRKHPQFAAGRLQLALDMVRLEWAEIEAFDSAAEPPVTIAALQNVNPARLRLKLQPYIRLLDLRYPVDDLLLAIKHDTGTNVASNAMAERQKRKKVSAVARLKPVPTYLAVHRVENMVYFRRLEREEFAILSALQSGKSLARAIEAGFRKSRVPIAQQASDASAWFRNWAALGWFL